MLYNVLQFCFSSRKRKEEERNILTLNLSLEIESPLIDKREKEATKQRRRVGVEWKTLREGGKLGWFIGVEGGKVDNKVSLCLEVSWPMSPWAFIRASEGGLESVWTNKHKLLFPLQMFPPFDASLPILFPFFDPRGQSAFGAPAKSTSSSPLLSFFLSLFSPCQSLPLNRFGKITFLSQPRFR